MSRPARGTRPAKVQEWSARLDRFHASQISVADFHVRLPDGTRNSVRPDPATAALLINKLVTPGGTPDRLAMRTGAGGRSTRRIIPRSGGNGCGGTRRCMTSKTKRSHFFPEDRLALRQEKGGPIWDEMRSFLAGDGEADRGFCRGASPAPHCRLVVVCAYPAVSGNTREAFAGHDRPRLRSCVSPLEEHRWVGQAHGSMSRPKDSTVLRHV